ncbi:MAG: hypothetical protein BKP49_01700 [Treponema sp. CETP13]|nr:MAG: hypothetical protein BKP49_01700 [Treponema sp. CETP13]
MNFNNFPIGPDDCGRRLDRIVRKFLPDLQISFIYKNIRTGFIRINNKKQKQDYILQPSDVINIASLLIQKGKSNPTKKNLEDNQSQNLLVPTILFKNDNFLAINKPYDVPVQGSSQNDISLNRIITKLYNPKNFSLTFTPGPLHRLDRRTTGTLIFSQSLKGAQWFSQAMQNKTITKEYLGLVCGKVTQNHKWIDFIDDSYHNNNGFRIVRVVDATQEKISPVAKKAITNIIPLKNTVIEALGKKIPITLCKFIIETGRMHQIRAQSAYHGFPLAGDSAYSTGIYADIKLRSFGIHDSKNKEKIPEFLLHAIRLKSPQNDLGLPTEIIAPLPTFFKNIITTYFASLSFKFIL